jgi:uncharacterized repeat protein (TIGR03803 family)
MCQTHLMRILALEGLAPDGKRSKTNQKRRRAAAVMQGFAAWLACALTAMAQAPPVTETVLLDFENSAPKGANPNGGVVRDSAGNLYGTASSGGAGNAGVVYKVNPAGRVTPVYSFKGGIDGSAPQAGVIGDSAGNLYGVTADGGAANAGIVFKINSAGQETVLYSFTGGADGYLPSGSLIRDAAGNLYGATAAGGSGVGFAGFGVVYKVNPSGNETVLYTFTGRTDGGYPNAGVIRDAAGNLYGTASDGGDLNACGGYGCGVIFKLDPSGKETVLYSFTGGADGAYPEAAVIGDWAGNLYSTAVAGGDLSACSGSGCGVVFKLDASTKETVLYAFTGAADGSGPFAGVTRDEAGNLYGTTASGGDLSGCNQTGCGVVYVVDTSGNETVLHSFAGGTDGSMPSAGVIRDAAGNLYGTTSSSGSLNVGTVYRLSAAGQETVYGFPSSYTGSNPFYSGVVPGESGVFYGTTGFGGSANDGVVYELSADGQETVLYNFTGGPYGANPNGLMRDAAGNLFGTASGGAGGAGVVFKLDKPGNRRCCTPLPAGRMGPGRSESWPSTRQAISTGRPRLEARQTPEWCTS